MVLRRQDWIMRIGILGGSFDPVHLGHLMIGEAAYESLGLSKVIFVPANVRPHKKNRHGADPKDRCAMVRAAVRGCPHFEASDIELRRRGISYTIDTLREMKGLYGSKCQIYFIIGADTIPELPTWKDVREVGRLCTLVVAARPGAALRGMGKLTHVIGRTAVARMRRNILRAPLIGVSSSEIRRRVRAGRSIRYMVPEPVENYIIRRRLYRD